MACFVYLQQYLCFVCISRLSTCLSVCWTYVPEYVVISIYSKGLFISFSSLPPVVASSRKTQQVFKPPLPPTPFPLLSCTGVPPTLRTPCVHKILDRRGCERQQPVLPRVSPGVYREHASAVRGKGAFDRVPRQSREPRAGACATGVSPYLCVARHERLPPVWW